MDSDEAVECLKAGACDYLLKDRLERLPSAVKRALELAEEQRLRKISDERLREQASLLDQSQDAIYVRDLDWRIIYWNKGAERLYGWKFEEVAGTRVGEAFTAPLAEQVCGEIKRTVMEKGVWVGEEEHVSKPGKKLIVETQRILLRDELGQPKSILITTTDITERKMIQNQAFRTQRMESLGTLAGGVAHDLNNALAPIIMGAAVLRSKFPDDTQMTDIIENSAMRAADMVRQLLTFARGVEGMRQPIQMQHLLKEMEKIIKSTFPKNIQLHAKYAAKLQTVLGDATQLHQVLLNLCVNARDAMPAVATVWTFLLTCSAAAETTPAWAEVSSALLTICSLVAESSSEDELKACEFCATISMVRTSLASAFLRAVTSVAYSTTLNRLPLRS